MTPTGYKISVQVQALDFAFLLGRDVKGENEAVDTVVLHVFGEI